MANNPDDGGFGWSLCMVASSCVLVDRSTQMKNHGVRLPSLNQPETSDTMSRCCHRDGADAREKEHADNRVWPKTPRSPFYCQRALYMSSWVVTSLTSVDAAVVLEHRRRSVERRNPLLRSVLVHLGAGCLRRNAKSPFFFFLLNRAAGSLHWNTK